MACKSILISLFLLSLLPVQTAMAGGAYHNGYDLTCLYFYNGGLIHQQICDANIGGGGNWVGAYGHWDIKNPIGKAFPQAKMLPFVKAGFLDTFNERHQELEKIGNQHRATPLPLTPLGTPRLTLESEIEYALDKNDKHILDKQGKPKQTTKYYINELPATVHWRDKTTLTKTSPNGKKVNPKIHYICLSLKQNPKLEACIDKDFYL